MNYFLNNFIKHNYCQNTKYKLKNIVVLLIKIDGLHLPIRFFAHGMYQSITRCLSSFYNIKTIECITQKKRQMIH